MSRPSKVYRIVVTKWPTPDGSPWPRFISPSSTTIDGWDSAAYPGDPNATEQKWVPFSSEGGWPNELEHRIRTYDIGSMYGVLEQGILSGMVLPGERRTFLSRTAAEAWVHDARLLGAECHIEVGDILWT